MDSDAYLTGDPLPELIRLKKQQIASLRTLLANTELELESLIQEQMKNKRRELPPLPRIDKLSNSAVSRYSRQMILPELRPEGQRRLMSSSVLIVGCGGE